MLPNPNKYFYCVVGGNSSIVEGSWGVSYSSREGRSVDFHIAAEEMSGVFQGQAVEITPLNLG